MDPNASPEAKAAAEAAAKAALRAFNIEAFTLLAVGVLVVALRSYVRISSVGWKNLWADDYLVVVGIVVYGIETGLAYSVGNIAHGLANNSMTPEQRVALHPSDPEYGMRVLGSKIQLAGWSIYSLLLWIMKAAMCTFYYRLTKDLEGYRKPIMIGFGLIIASWVTVQLNLILSCRPFHHWWQISPDPGPYCHPAISPALVWTYLSFNVATDLYLIMIPMPMLWKAAMPWFQKIMLIALFSCGLFVTMAAILRVVLLVSDPVNGAQLAGSWAVRETFVAVITTNIPMLFPHVKKYVGPIVSIIGSSLSFSRNTTKDRATSKGSKSTTLDTWRRKSRRSSRPLPTNSTRAADDGNESEEHFIGPTEQYSLADLAGKGAVMRSNTVTSSATCEEAGIQRQLEVSIDEESSPTSDRRLDRTLSGNYTSTWANSASRPAPDQSKYFLQHVHQDAYEKP